MGGHGPVTLNPGHFKKSLRILRYLLFSYQHRDVKFQPKNAFQLPHKFYHGFTCLPPTRSHPGPFPLMKERLLVDASHPESLPAGVQGGSGGHEGGALVHVKGIEGGPVKYPGWNI